MIERHGELHQVEAEDVEEIYFKTLSLWRCAIHKEWSLAAKGRLEALQTLQTSQLTQAHTLSKQKRAAVGKSMLWNMLALMTTLRFQNRGEEDPHLRVTDKELIRRFIEALIEPREPHPTDFEMNKTDELEIRFRSRKGVKREPIRYRFYRPYLAFCFGPKFAQALQMLGAWEADRMKSLLRGCRTKVERIRIGASEATDPPERNRILSALNEVDGRAFDFAHPFYSLKVDLFIGPKYYLQIPFTFRSGRKEVEQEGAEAVLPPLLWDYFCAGYARR